MRKNNIGFLLALGAVCFLACNKQEAPGGTLKLGDDVLAIYKQNDYLLYRENPLKSSDTIFVGAPLTYVVTNGDGDTYVLWPGEPGFDYENRFASSKVENHDANYLETNDVGLFMTKKEGEFVREEYAYTKPGNHTLTLVGRNIYDKGDSYKEMVEKIPVLVVDTACFISRFTFVIPADANTDTTHVDGGIQPCFAASEISKASSVTMAIGVGAADLEASTGELTWNQRRGWYDWKNADLTKDQTLTVIAQSPEFKRIYTIKKVQECTE